MSAKKFVAPPRWSLSNVEKQLLQLWYARGMPLSIAAIICDYLAHHPPSSSVPTSLFPIAYRTANNETPTQTQAEARSLEVLTWNALMDAPPPACGGGGGVWANSGVVWRSELPTAASTAIEANTTATTATAKAAVCYEVAARMRRLCRYVESLARRPDVVCLQEVTGTMATAISRDKWVSSNYGFSVPPSDGSLHPYGQWTLYCRSFANVGSTSITISGSHKRVTAVRIPSLDMVVVNLHLATRTLWLQRVVELRRLQIILDEWSNPRNPHRATKIMLVGDFNMDHDYLELSLIDPRFADVYAWHPSIERLPTYEPNKNRLAKLLCPLSNHRSFFDRVYLSRLATDPNNPPHVHTAAQDISDHFPLSCTVLI